MCIKFKKIVHNKNLTYYYYFSPKNSNCKQNGFLFLVQFLKVFIGFIINIFLLLNNL